MKKYIINDLPGQKITGDLDIEGGFRVIDGNYTIGKYRALMTQTGSITGSSLNDFYGALVIGQVYTITNYIAGDDFFNVGQVISGSMNQTGCQFIATGEVPSWDNSSSLSTQGELVVQVLENTLGFDIEWSVFSTGVYLGVRSTPSALYNTFPRSLVFARAGDALPLGVPLPLKKYCGPSGIGEKDQSIALVVFNENIQSTVANGLYYTPIEIDLKIDLNTTPITLTGNSPGVPIQNVYIDIYSYDTYVTTIYADNTDPANNLTELVNLLNNDTQTGYLGTFSVNQGVISLVMPTNVKKQFSPNTPLGFEVGGSGV